MPEIRLADEAGACFGVERAIDMVEAALAQNLGEISTIGPLIHNPQVVASLEERGVGVVEDAESQAEGSTIVLRTHGVPPELVARAQERKLNIIDATCPYVTKTHRDVELLASEGYQIVVVGEKGHAEVEATMAHAPGSICISSPDEAASAKLAKKVGVVVQTTQTKRLLEEVVAALVTRCDELRVINTICAATEDRQSSAQKLAQEADVMVVIGGKNSANTTHLAEICKELCPNTHHIEVADELEAAWFDASELIGVTAGASTPHATITDVMKAIEGLTNS